MFRILPASLIDEEADYYGFSLTKTFTDYNIMSTDNTISNTLMHRMQSDENWNNPESIALMSRVYRINDTYATLIPQTTVNEFDYQSIKLEQNKMFSNRFLERGNISFKEGQYADAVKYFSEAVRYNSKSITALIRKATALSLVGDITGSKRDLQQAQRMLADCDVKERSECAADLAALAERIRFLDVGSKATLDKVTATNTAAISIRPEKASGISFLEKLQQSLMTKTAVKSASSSAQRGGGAVTVASSSSSGAYQYVSASDFVSSSGGIAKELRSINPGEEDALSGSGDSSESDESSDRRSGGKKRKRKKEKKASKKKSKHKKHKHKKSSSSDV